MNKRDVITYVICAILGVIIGWNIGPIIFEIASILDDSNEAETVSQEECCGTQIEVEANVLIITPDDIEQESYFDSLEMLAVCVEAEAGNQPLDGRRMVADVILNRVDNPDFPDTIEGVISQPYHFSSYWDGGMDKVIEPSELTIKAVQMELRERGYPGILYFKEGEYSDYGTPWRKVGNHYFSIE